MKNRNIFLITLLLFCRFLICVDQKTVDKYGFGIINGTKYWIFLSDTGDIDEGKIAAPGRMFFMDKSGSGELGFRVFVREHHPMPICNSVVLKINVDGLIRARFVEDDTELSGFRLERAVFISDKIVRRYN